MVEGVGRKAGFNAIPSVLWRFEFKTELDTLKVTSPLLSKLTALASKLLILKLIKILNRGKDVKLLMGTLSYSIQNMFFSSLAKFFIF